MTATIQDLQARLGLSTGALARLVGVERRTVQRWLAGTQDVAEPARRLLMAVEAYPEVMAWLRGVTAKKIAGYSVVESTEEDKIQPANGECSGV